MLIQPIDYFLVVWFVLVAASTLYVGIDQYRNNPEPLVMKWGFILVTLYMGPIGMLLYVLADKEPRPGDHETFISPLWKQGIGSTIHCVAGDATGIIAAAVITAALGLPMWIDLIVEYLAGFAFGLFIFQALFMKSMMGGGYWQNVRRSFLPEFISMNFMMAGMGPTMSLLMMGRDMRAMEPTELLFWGIMSLGVIVGFTTAYPANVWLVKRRLKHGLMTVRGVVEDKTPGSPSTSNDGMQETSDHRMGAMPAGQMTAAEPAAKAEQPAKDDPMSGGEDHSKMAMEAGHQGHGSGDSKGDANHQMKTDATTSQLAALCGVSLVALLIGLVAPANWVNLRLSAHDVGGAIMPPGMIMDRDTPAAAMLDMAAVDPRSVTASFGVGTRGDRELPSRLEDGVRTFRLETSVIRWAILPGISVDAYAFNNQVPGPRIRLRQGERVRIDVINRLPESTTVHWHGLILPNVMDGPAQVTQIPIEQGKIYRYEFTPEQSGTYFYHSHDHADRQQALGLYGALIIDPAVPDPSLRADHDYTIMLQEWLMREGLTYPAMPMDGGQPNYFTINGKAYPQTDTIAIRVGETLKVRFVGSNNGFIHPMHIHGGPFTVVAVDGNTLQPSARYDADTINVGPGQRYDVIWRARRPGKWLIHCHIAHHTTNNNVEMKGGGGLMMLIDVKPQPVAGRQL